MSARSVIVTGAAEGIGAACARRFAENGDHLVLVDKDEEAGRAMAHDLSREDRQVSFVQADISSRLSVHNIIAETLESFDRIDVLVHAAVAHFEAPFMETSEEDFSRVIDHNLKGSFLINQAVAKQMVRQIEDIGEQNLNAVSDQAIVNIGSVEGITTQADHVAFAASQGGLHQLTKAVALSLSPHGIRVNTVGVGPMRGEGKTQATDDPVSALARVGEPEDAANVAWFLTSKESAFVTGQTIFVDGGQLVRNHHANETRS